MKTKVIMSISEQSTHRILLSGTPMDYPRHLFSQIYIVNPTIFPRFWNESDAFENGNFYYATRYCKPIKVPLNRFHRNGYKGYKVKHIYTFDGCERESELNAILSHCIMIRRKKQDVLSQLPPKIRERIIIDKVSKKDLFYGISDFDIDDNNDNFQLDTDLSKDMNFMEKWRMMAEIKVDKVKEYIKSVIIPQLEHNPNKIILYGHHRNMLSMISEEMKSNNIGYILIDGSVPNIMRGSLVEKFQADNNEVRVAILSICAANSGITLTKATVMYITELYWSPVEVLQCEDRVHRIGQHNSVLIQYLILEGSTDEILWYMICNKARCASKCIDNKNINNLSSSIIK